MTSTRRRVDRPMRLIGLAWALWCLAVVGVAAVVMLDQVLRRSGHAELIVLTPGAFAPVLGAIGVATIGTVVASRRPRHPVGWLLLAFGLCLDSAGVLMAYAHYGLIRPGAIGAGALVWYVPTTIVAAVVCNNLILLLTPKGTLPSPRWRWYVAIIAAVPVALIATLVMATRSAGPAVALDSPLDLGAFTGVPLAAYRAAFAVTMAGAVVAGASLLDRFRRARGVERQQLRWVVWATAAVAVVSALNVVQLVLGAYRFAPVVGGLNPLILAAAIGAAVLRYRLYDLDRIISRTLAYGLLTVVLGAGYTAVTLAVGALLPQSSTIAVAAATLTVAAAFHPARQRIQQVVDRRFNRRRHDAGRLIEAFGERVRDAVDVELDTLAADILAVVDNTMQPTLAALWLPDVTPRIDHGRGVYLRPQPPVHQH
jgi:hypothetical protein